MEKNFIKVQSNKDIIISLTLIILGAALALLPLGGATNVTGIFIAITGIILVFTLKNVYKESISGERYSKKEYFYHINLKNELINHIKTNPKAIEAGSDVSNNSLSMVIFYSKHSGKAYLQLQEYIPYKYEACTEMQECTLSEVEHLIK